MHSNKETRARTRIENVLYGKGGEGAEQHLNMRIVIAEELEMWKRK